jgi:hypothetical protein
MPDGMQVSPKVSAAVRTLLASGYDIDTSGERYLYHIELRCEKPSILGVRVRFLIAITEASSFTAEQIGDIQRIAKQENRTAVFVGTDSTDSQLGWQEFLSSLGGEVPSWRAVSPTYPQALLSAATNKLPPGMTSGEAWLLFEDLVCDGLEFILGRRAHRLGGRRRGQPVSDIVAVLPCTELLVVDAKATGIKGGFDANWPALRPLVEYARKQQQRQHGFNVVHSAVIVSSEFSQGSKELRDLSDSFLSETRIPLGFLTAEKLAEIVRQIQSSIDLRAAVNWKRFFIGGELTVKAFEHELSTASKERVRVSEY